MKYHASIAILTILLISKTFPSSGQDLKSPYFNIDPLTNSTDLWNPVNGGFPGVAWHHPGGQTGYTGEYEILLESNDFFWNKYSYGQVPVAQTVFISYDMEIVSFPFTPHDENKPNITLKIVK